MTTSKRLQLSNVGLPSNLLHAIGHVAALWAQLEFMIDSMINEALNLPGAPSVNPKLMVPFNERLNLLETLCRQFIKDPEELSTSIEKIEDLKQLVSQRNLIVHGAVQHSKRRKKGRVVYWFRRVAWDMQPKIVEKRALTVSDVERFAKKVSDQVALIFLVHLYLWVAERALRGKSPQ